MSHVLPLRWSLAVLPVLPGLVLAGLAAVLLGQLVVGLAAALLAVAVLARRARRRTLTLTPQCLVVRRDDYLLLADWEDVVAVDRPRRQGLAQDELVLRRSELRPHVPGPAADRLLQRVQHAGADSRIQVSSYDRHWRRGPVGARLRAQGVPGV